ncbi:hypothetical protein [Pseudomonas sp. BN515]|uniref:hypothetical protein n=1 Tax=Pseudomonas sp. BN515 TaxID=2567892 RepID=UPI0024562A87|nr:hypothetical protein [Pseudomonas sp. BN515]MDH4869319.1 hypothetical protein [Pseudomonas sp. BN515]
MTAPHEWKHSVADVYASKYGAVAQDFLALVVTPSLDALERRWDALLTGDNKIRAAFESLDHAELINKTSSAFCLSIQSLWERYFRRYLLTCPNALAVEGVTREKLEKAHWGEKPKELGGLFRKIRGLDLESFDSYSTLNKLQLLANVCRHGDGPSARELHDIHPSLWPEWTDTPELRAIGAVPPSVDLIKISRELLTQFVNAIDVFWMDMECRALESFGIGEFHIERQIANLREARIPKLLTFKPESAQG